MTHRIGFVSTRLAGMDGVSLEVAKWTGALELLDCECYYFAGECEWPAERSYVVPEAHFQHSTIQTLQASLFGKIGRGRETSRTVDSLKNLLKDHLYQFISNFKLESLIVENALAIPLNIPLGLALTELIAEMDMRTIAHHHDFYWERTRFDTNAAGDYLRMAFPPTLRSIRHVVINSFASRQLALRTGASSITLIPNVMNFEQPPPEPDSLASDMRQRLGLAADDIFLLQPTRIVPRKRIEHAIYLTRLLGNKAALVISHSSGDEGADYDAFLREYAEALGVRVLFAANYFGHRRSQAADGQTIYSLADAYQEADLVTYPSSVEGFGNAFLETVYYKRPIVMSTYEIFKTDIQPKGFQIVGFEDFISEATMRQVRHLLDSPASAREMVETNYELGRRYYSYHTLQQQLKALLLTSIGR